jgi:hypothetical protein
LSQDLYDFLRQRARMRGLGWPVCLSVSLAFHGLVVAAILASRRK